MSSPTARRLRRRSDQHETTTAKKSLIPVMDSADGIVTGSALTDNSPVPPEPNSHGMSGGATSDSGMREKLVREAAYFRAERRGFAPGGELEDWVAAEREVDQLLMARKIIPVGFVG